MCGIVAYVGNKLCRQIVLDGLARNFLCCSQSQASAAREVSIHHDKVVLHLDDDVIAVTHALEVALAKPHAGDNLFYSVWLRFAIGKQQSNREQRHEERHDPEANVFHTTE